MSTADSKPTEIHVPSRNGPLSVSHFGKLVQAGEFDSESGQIELIHGKILQINPQGPRHAFPIDILAESSIEQTKRRFWVRVEKPIEIPELSGTPEPDIASLFR